MSNKKFISWIVSQDGETMVIVILLLIVTTLTGVIYNFNDKLDQCTLDKFNIQVEYSLKKEQDYILQKSQYEEKIKELTELYEERLNEIKNLKSTIDKTIKETKNEIDKH